MSNKKTAMVIGVGAVRGLGAALCRKFALEGFHVYVVGRTLEKIQNVVTAINNSGGSAESLCADVTAENDIVSVFDHVSNRNDSYHFPELVVFNVGNNKKIDFLSLAAKDVEDFFKVGTLAGFIVSREAIKRMLPQGKGTLLFTGASSSLRGKPGYAHFSSAKAGIRMLSQSLAREFGPAGIHIAHVIIDGGIDGELMESGDPQRYQKLKENGLLTPEGIADVFYFLHCQPPAVWTQEIDIRPSQEMF